VVVQETRSVECAACCLGANGLLRAAPVLKTPSRAPKIALHERTATDTRRASENSDSGRPATITMDKNEPTPEAPRSSEVAISQRKAVFSKHGTLSSAWKTVSSVRNVGLLDQVKHRKPLVPYPLLGCYVSRFLSPRTTTRRNKVNLHCTKLRLAECEPNISRETTPRRGVDHGVGNGSVR
jgi:hypothetical protein